MDQEQVQSDPGLPIFQLGFRPFFLGAILLAVVHISIWTLAFTLGISLDLSYTTISWHSHEMLFGYTLAVIAGFLLTAVRNWTGLPTLSGAPLAGLVAIWLVARFAPLLSLPALLAAVIDLAFPLLLMVALALPIIRARMVRNFPFPFILFGFFLSDLLVHLEELGVTNNTARQGTYLMLYLILLVITVIFGRVFPFFTSRVLPEARVVKRVWLERCCILSVVGVCLAELFAPDLLLPACLIAAACHGLRLIGFYPRGMMGLPLLSVLFFGYGWIVVGFALKAGATAGLLSPFLALHALTAGGVGVLTLGMMVRVALGHTGRPLEPGVATRAAFVVLNLAVFTRIIPPVFFPVHYFLWLQLATVLWVLAFVLLAFVLCPILLRPRLDGKPG